MNKNKSAIIFIVVIIAALGILFALPRLGDPNREIVKTWRAAGIDCLPSHANANLHIHPTLEIEVSGRRETIPANLGIVRGCMAEVHIHDISGTIHLESVSAGKTFTLGQFFAISGKSLERPGFRLEMTVDGSANAQLGNLILKDKQKIVLKYQPVVQPSESSPVKPQ